VTAAAALASFELEYSGRSQWLRRLLPGGEGTNVVGVLPARGARQRTLVLVGHHDAAHTGLMWHPRLVAGGDARAARTHRRASFALIPEAALLLAAASRRRLPRRGAAAALALAAALTLQCGLAATVPGANDNATGVAGLLALVERLSAERPDGLELVALVAGCEESGMGGMAAWLHGNRRLLDARRTLVVGLDTIGSGMPVVTAAEGGMWPVRYRDEDLLLAERAAGRAGVPLRRWRLGGWTDPALARLSGLPAVSILSVRDGGFPNYHRPSDTPERVDWRSVQQCVQLVEALIREW
jgi:hypothetical protein